MHFLTVGKIVLLTEMQKSHTNFGLPSVLVWCPSFSSHTCLFVEVNASCLQVSLARDTHYCFNNFFIFHIHRYLALVTGLGVGADYVSMK